MMIYDVFFLNLSSFLWGGEIHESHDLPKGLLLNFG